MIKKIALGPILIFVSMVALSAGSGNSIRCKGRLIQAGDSRLKVRSLCGEPGDKFSLNQKVMIHERYIIRSSSSQTSHFVSESFEEISSQPFVANHKHENIRNHNFRATPVLVTKTGQIRRSSFHGRHSQYQEFWQCHEKTINLERWTYNLGPSRFIRKLEFNNSILVKISFGEYGF